MKKLHHHLIRFFFPDECGSCGSVLRIDERWVCERCRGRIVLAETDLKPEVAHAGSLDGVYAGFFYDDTLQAAIHQFKYERALSLSRWFAARLLEVMRTELPLASVDLIVPLPLHPIKERTRGYNQANLVAAELSKLSGIAMDARCIKRIRNNNSQTTMRNARERALNVADAFVVTKGDKIVNRKIALIDDLITTGATINECARVLKSAGAGAVYGLSVGRPLINRTTEAAR